MQGLMRKKKKREKSDYVYVRKFKSKMKTPTIPSTTPPQW